MDDLDALRWSRLFRDNRRITVLVYAKQQAVGGLVRIRRRLGEPHVVKGLASRFAPRMEELSAGLEALGLLGAARRNDRAGLFAVEVDLEQLNALSRLPAVQRIESNRVRFPLSGLTEDSSYADLMPVTSALGPGAKGHSSERGRDRRALETERTVRYLNSGALDEAMNRLVPESPPRDPEKFVDIEPFSYGAWKKRRGLP